MKDIKAERPKISEKDNLRLLFVTNWFLAFFLAMRGKELGGERPQVGREYKWRFEYVAEVVERGWVVWMLKRITESMDTKVVTFRFQRSSAPCSEFLIWV